LASHPNSDSGCVEGGIGAHRRGSNRRLKKMFNEELHKLFSSQNVINGVIE
jgi:hypothetical protein